MPPNGLPVEPYGASRELSRPLAPTNAPCMMLPVDHIKSTGAEVSSFDPLHCLFATPSLHGNKSSMDFLTIIQSTGTTIDMDALAAMGLAREHLPPTSVPCGHCEIPEIRTSIWRQRKPFTEALTTLKFLGASIKPNVRTNAAPKYRRNVSHQGQWSWLRC